MRSWETLPIAKNTMNSVPNGGMGPVSNRLQDGSRVGRKGGRAETSLLNSALMAQGSQISLNNSLAEEDVSTVFPDLALSGNMPGVRLVFPVAAAILRAISW
jgi:hypothetical protein